MSYRIGNIRIGVSKHERESHQDIGVLLLILNSTGARKRQTTNYLVSSNLEEFMALVIV